jgi:hypothetical protein
VTVELVPFDSTDRLNRVGISDRSISEIFLGTQIACSEPRLVSGTPTYAKEFIRREYFAGDFPFRAVQRREIRVPDLWTGEIVSCRRGFASPAQGNLPYDILPLYYRLTGARGNEFWLICYATYGRITHLFLPEQRMMICDLDRHAAPVLAEHLVENLCAFRSASERASGSASPPRVVAVLDMVHNFGHQLINHLSGLERLLDRHDLPSADEIWVAGVEFFSSVERLFPELASKIVRFANRWDMSSQLLRGSYLPLRIGTNVFRSRLLDRLSIDRGSAVKFGRKKTNRTPILAVTIRTAGRKCLNLSEVVLQAIAALAQRYPNIGVILDGWVLPDSQVIVNSELATIWLKKFHRDAVFADLEVARKIADHLPTGTLVANLIGSSMTASLRRLRNIDAYFSHVGTLQHKISFVTGSQGVVHGPKSQLEAPDTGHFQADRGFAPVFLNSPSVRDVATFSTRGTSFRDYEIMDVDDVISKLDSILAAQLRSEPRNPV